MRACLCVGAHVCARVWHIWRQKSRRCEKAAASLSLDIYSMCLSIYIYHTHTHRYVKMNRKRLKGSAGPAEARVACGVLFEVFDHFPFDHLSI